MRVPPAKHNCIGATPLTSTAAAVRFTPGLPPFMPIPARGPPKAPSTHVRSAEHEPHVLHASRRGGRFNHHDGRHSRQLSRRAVPRSVQLTFRHQHLSRAGRGQVGGRDGCICEL